jgi:hypothetical protein
MRARPLITLQDLTAAALCAMATLYVFAFAGCDTVDELVDIETAENEAIYIPVEVAATLALGVTRAQDYGAYSSVVQHSYSVGQPITTDGCIGIDMLDLVDGDGSGSLRYDFAACSGQGGAVQVAQTVVLDGQPAGDDWEDMLNEDYEGELPEGGAPEDLRDLLETSGDVEVSYQGYSEGMLEMNGVMAFSGGVAGGDEADGGSLSAQVQVAALDYSAMLRADGTWSSGPSSDDSRLLSFSGEFVSATGLTWTVIARNVEMVPDCADAVGGELTAIYNNDMGRVEVTARFDDVCDGCADLVIDGQERGKTCYAAADWFGTDGGTEAY